MRTNTEGLLNKFPAVTACLRGVTRGHSDHTLSGTLSLGSEDSEERTPGGIHDGFRQMMIFHHVGDLKVFNDNALIAFRIGLGCLEMMVSTLTIDLQMCLGNVAGCLTKPFAALLAAAQLTLLASQGFLRRTIEARVRDAMTFTIREEGRETNINADIRMLACIWEVLIVWFRLTDDECIPMPICTMDKVNCLGRAHKLPMQLDLEEVA